MPVVSHQGMNLCSSRVSLNPVIALGRVYSMNVAQVTSPSVLLFLPLLFVRMMVCGHFSRRPVQVSKQNFFFFNSKNFFIALEIFHTF